MLRVFDDGKAITMSESRSYAVREEQTNLNFKLIRKLSLFPVTFFFHSFGIAPVETINKTF